MNLRLLQEMANSAIASLPGDLKTMLRAKVTEKLGTDPENYNEEDAAEEGAEPEVAGE